MSLYDRQQGIFDGAAIAAAATARQYGAAIDEWEAHAKALKGRLHNAEAKADQANASRAAMAYLIGQLANELEKYAPNHPLVNRQRRVEIVDDGGVSRNRRNFRQPINVAYLTLGRCVPASPA